MQSKKHSMLESLTNVMIGYVVALLSQLIVFPLFNILIPLSDNLQITGYFTLISLLRSYVVRRYFNRKIVEVPTKKFHHTLNDKFLKRRR